MAIENIQPGDMVLAANEETGEVAYKEVVRTFVNTTDEITHVTIENAEGEKETIDSTPEHPFYVEGKGWVEASALHPGMTIWLANGTKGTVEDISNEGLEEPVTVYNFEVEDFHTYFVGDSGVLVHNTCSTNKLETTADFISEIENRDGKYYTDKATIDKIGQIEAAGEDFSLLNRKIMSSRPSTEGGSSTVYKYSDESGTKFIIHEVTDADGFIIHRDFDAVRIESGQLINKSH